MKPSNDSIPRGLCQCGCGQPTTIAIRTNAKNGQVKGEPLRFLLGHNGYSSLAEYAVDAETGCWNWLRGKTLGYGYKWVDGKKQPAHRVFFERANGPIPNGLQIDHLCRNRGCVNPDHLQAVTQRVNIQRGAVAKITPEMLDEIRSRYNVDPVSQIAVDLNLSERAVRSAARGETWGAPVDVTGRKNFRKGVNAKLTMDDAREMRRMRADGKLLKEIAILFHVTPSRVCTIVNNLAWLDE